MSSILELIKKYQHTIEKYPDDEKKLLRCIEKLDHLDVTVKHLEDTGVGRTVNSLRKEPGPVGEASRALVKEWKYMVATEEKSDPEDYAESTSYYNGNGDNDSHDQSPRHDYYKKNGDSDNKRKHEESDDDIEDNYKRTRYSNNEESNEDVESSNHDDEHINNHNDDESDISEYSEEDVMQLKAKAESPERYSTKKTEEKYSHSKHKDHNEKYKHSNDSRHNSKEKTAKHSLSSQSSSSDKRSKTKESKHDKSTSQKHESKPEKSKSHKNDELQRHSSSEKERSKKHKSSKEKSDSESKERSKHKSSHKDKDEKKSSEKKQKSSESKSKSGSSKESSGSSSSRSKSSSSKSKNSSKEDSSRRNKTVAVENVVTENGIDCGSGASFAEALGMISPVKAKKKTVSSPRASNDLMPSALLSSKCKLAPLPPLEISALPEISPNYKPMPPPKLLSHINDTDAMNAGISSKNQRTKVYSGNKTVGKVYTLYELCVQVLQTHIDSLEFTGGVPYEILKPVVDRATPDQLFVLENYNPYLMEDTQHLWKLHCQKRFRNKHREEMETWRDMFIRCQDEQEIKLRSLTANIKMAQEVKKAPVKQTKMAYVDSVVKPPRNILRKQAQHGTARTASASPAARVPALASAANLLTPGARANLTPIGGVNTTFKPKKAPLMQKALQFMRGRKR